MRKGAICQCATPINRRRQQKRLRQHGLRQRNKYVVKLTLLNNANGAFMAPFADIICAQPNYPLNPLYEKPFGPPGNFSGLPNS